MKIFALIILVIIMITVQHLLNWIWRFTKKDLDIVFPAICFSVIVVVITLRCGYYFLLWYNQ